MRAEKLVLCLIFGAIFTALTQPIQAEEIHCPSNCHCSTGFKAVKCSGMDAFPVFDFAARVRSLDLSRGYITFINRNNLKAYENLERLDIRHNDIKSVSPGLFSEMETLRELFIDDNPWSCDMSTLQVLQMELIALIDKNSHLDNFDGGRIKCADPPDMKGKKPLQLINSTVKVYHVHNRNKADSHPQTPAGGLIALAVFLVVLLLVVICRVAWVFRDDIQNFITEAWKPKVKSNQVDIMESGKIDNRKLLTDSMKKRRCTSKGIPTADSATSTSSDDDNHRKVSSRKEYLKDKMRKQKRQSRGFAKGESSSSSEGEERCLTNAVDSKEYLKDKMRKQRRQSQGFAEGDSSSDGEESGLLNAIDPNKYLKDKMRMQRRQSCGIAEGDCSSDGDESGLLNAIDPTEYLKDKMRAQRRQSCGIAEGDCSSGEESAGFITIDLDP